LAFFYVGVAEKNVRQGDRGPSVVVIHRHLFVKGVSLVHVSVREYDTLGGAEMLGFTKQAGFLPAAEGAESGRVPQSALPAQREAARGAAK